MISINNSRITVSAAMDSDIVDLISFRRLYCQIALMVTILGLD